MSAEDLQPYAPELPEPAGDAGMPAVAQVSTADRLGAARPPELLWFGPDIGLQPADYLVSKYEAQSAIAAVRERLRVTEELAGQYLVQRDDARDAIAAQDARIAELERRVNWLKDAECTGRMAGDPPRYVPDCKLMGNRIIGLEADMRERDEHIAWMRTEHGQEVADLKARIAELECRKESS
jgi:hypothetical protein